ncbi:hypothetical protein L1987_85152 [Smallanthus sonchifolius]|uniref:Uncharacterized protein n=1 Tax=Smallanthus sonchifolius TaxID=185202 RepID=A0ACB8XWJ5_9ASTR|nr:hypothetical protein L1987_85152 [Smallanthus sonchifolius]
MAKLIALALAFAALVAFATAHTTIVTTTIEDENPVSRQRQCSQQLQGQRFNQCRMYLQQGQSPFEDNRQRGQQQQGIQQCCQELQNVEEQCQCEAAKQVFRDVQQQQGQFGSQQTQQLKQRAQMIPNQCNLQSRQCQIGNIMTESNIDIPFRSGSQQCRESEIQRPVNQCQRECQCEAVEEVARKVIRQQQQGGRRQYGGQQDEREMVRRVVQNLPNQCYLDVKQCSIPYGMDA